MQGNRMEIREALGQVRSSAHSYINAYDDEIDRIMSKIVAICDAALAALQHKGKWENGTMYEYEYAYCSECGRMQWAGWDTHKQAEEEIESFASNYRYCPGCGAEMEGGVYVQ